MKGLLGAICTSTGAGLVSSELGLIPTLGILFLFVSVFLFIAQSEENRSSPISGRSTSDLF